MTNHAPIFPIEALGSDEWHQFPPRPAADELKARRAWASPPDDGLKFFRGLAIAIPIGLAAWAALFAIIGASAGVTYSVLNALF